MTMNEISHFDRVSIFNGKLSFLVPHEWIETFDDDHYLYYYPDSESGWLRVTLLTVKVDDETPAERLKDFFRGKQNVSVDPQTGNVVSVSEKNSEEDGFRIHIYYWMVANVVPPDLIREAIFSYTVLLDRIDEKNTKQMVTLVGQLVSQADFCPSV